MQIAQGARAAQRSPASNVSGSDSLAGFAAPAAAKANTCIVFSSDRGGNHQLYKMAKDGTMSKHHIWTMNADGSAPVQLTQGDSNDLHPSAPGL